MRKDIIDSDTRVDRLLIAGYYNLYLLYMTMLYTQYTNYIQ